MIKVAVLNMACQVIDWAIQSFGAAGVSAEYGLAYAYSNARLIRIADGPDEVHRNQIARLELGRYGGEPSKRGGNAHVAPPDITEGTNWKPRFMPDIAWMCLGAAHPRHSNHDTKCRDHGIHGTHNYQRDLAVSLGAHAPPTSFRKSRSGYPESIRAGWSLHGSPALRGLRSEARDADPLKRLDPLVDICALLFRKYCPRPKVVIIHTIRAVRAIENELLSSKLQR